MFRWIFFLILLHQFSLFSAVDETLVEANRLYEKANEMGLKDPDKSRELYETAARKYKSVLDSGIRNPELHKNLANAYFRAGDKGRAVLHFHRALRLNPTDSDALHGINFMRSEVVDVPPGSEMSQVWSYIFFWHSWPFYLRIFLLALLGCVTWAGCARLLYGKNRFVKNTVFVSGFLSILIAGSLLVSSLYLDNNADAVITVREVEPRQGNGYIYEMALSGSLHSGTEFKILETRKKWYFIELQGGSRCWIPMNSATLIDEE